MSDKNIQITGSILMTLAVALGAFGAHGLESLLLQNGRIETYETAVLYHFVHALSIMIIASLNIGNKKIPIIFFVIGILCFSGSLYALSITNYTFLGMIAPIGGTAFIAGWLATAWSSFKAQPSV
jgi:uncharacterized membrane protein YgdD (TMEM256/DUF423 family)